jgi:hypothetical protein
VTQLLKEHVAVFCEFLNFAFPVLPGHSCSVSGSPDAQTRRSGFSPPEPESESVVATLSPGQRPPLLELSCSSTPTDPEWYRRYRFSKPSAPLLPALRYSHSKSEHPLSNRPRMLRRPRTCSLLQSPTGPNHHRTSRWSLSWGLVPFSACSSGSPVHSGLPHPTPSDSRVSHPLAGFLLPKPPGLVSCR